ncbi:MAG: WecB/TagA/CpsF family glycosyltransferase [Lachnospiraceae bacterium]|nr:WecB/TagA/CpsF family glycosyltransferase [Lachnospiraceae bacterium]
MESTLCFIHKNLERLRGSYICISNVHTTIMSYESETYRCIQNGAILALPDGKPLSILCRKRGFSETSRVAGPDLMNEIFKCSKKFGYTHYFYGSTSETLRLLKKRLITDYQLSIVGMYSPPFRELTKEEDEVIINKINQAKADFVWIGLGAPKQECWMYEHQNKLNGLMIGVGAGFDYFAGNIKRAPAWMQKCSLEWAYRLLQEPKRLFKRYLITNTKFIWLLIRKK